MDVINVSPVYCGSYFYLRRDVPLVFLYDEDPSEDTSDLFSAQGESNYVIACPKDAARLAKHHLEEIEIVHGVGIYRVGREQPISTARYL